MRVDQARFHRRFDAVTAATRLTRIQYEDAAF